MILFFSVSHSSLSWPTNTNALNLQSVFLIKIFISLNVEADQSLWIITKAYEENRFLVNHSRIESECVKSWGWEINYHVRWNVCLSCQPHIRIPFAFSLPPHERREVRGTGEEKFLWLNWTWKKNTEKGIIDLIKFSWSFQRIPMGRSERGSSHKTNVEVWNEMFI